MQSNPAVKVLALALLAGVIVLFVVVGGDDGGNGTDNSPVGLTEEQVNGEPDLSEKDGKDSKTDKKSIKDSKPKLPTIVYSNGEVKGGVQDLRFKKGETIAFLVRSDIADEVHLHGYDVSKDVSAGGKVKFNVPADIEGIFELELEASVTELATVRVEP